MDTERSRQSLVPASRKRRSFLGVVPCVTSLALAAPASAVAAFFGRVPDWPELKQSIRKRHPSVPQLSVTALREWLADATRQQPWLLDTRSRAEYAVSHLKDARHTADWAAALRELEGRPRDAPLVLYCSVGVRSSALAERLIQAGYRSVSNLEGSLFEWANLGYSVYRGAGAVSLVHPYNADWGRLLDRKLWWEGKP